ncbi:hypothetical protein GCM10025875_26520 [Litorihabitans aurantiacus]|uniref:Uncharacterized protein n=2 Tax=Litorihabitans aurantiacus TaxID=1930061 RepID=A0AA37XHF6_9MICO|nr:hypothetical protein GCM10025875_26520 [Litorihabitans aurantiacus]
MLHLATDADAVRAAVGSAVDTNMPWQEPDEEDHLLAVSGMVEALRPIAQALCDAPVGSTLVRGLDTQQQRHTRVWVEGSEIPATDPPEIRGLDGRAERWYAAVVGQEDRARRELPQDPTFPST